MAVEGGMKCVKYLLFLSNFIFWLCGLALIILGVLVQIALHKTLLIQDASASAPLVIIAVGVVILFISFFGCCGACKESHCMVTMFSVLLCLIIIVEIGAAIAAYVFRGKVTEVVQNSLTEMITRYSNSSEEFKKVVDRLQEDLKCCGIHNSSDWVHFKPDSDSVPDSCCVNVTTGCGVGTMTNQTIVHQEGFLYSTGPLSLASNSQLLDKSSITDLCGDFWLEQLSDFLR
ncbi:CD63 antigen [Aplochiton taeniatus]